MKITIYGRDQNNKRIQETVHLKDETPVITKRKFLSFGKKMKIIQDDKFIISGKIQV
jgi:hypothetical protein